MNDLNTYNFIIFNIDNNQLENVIDYIGNKKDYFLENLSEFLKYLSINQQKQIANIMQRNDMQYEINHHNEIKEALEIRNILPDNYEDKNYFELVDLFCNDLSGTKKEKSEEIQNDNNIWIKIYNWILNNNPLCDYNILVNTIELVSSDLKIWILKRYLHDIRLGNTLYNEKILIQFRNSFNEKIITSRKWLNPNENEKEHFVVSLFADCILTTKKTKGEKIETFNGILDLITQKYDENNTILKKIDYYFLPECKGATLNYCFKGFIEYNVICRLDENKLHNREYVKNVIYKILSKCNAHKDSNTNSWTFMNYLNNVSLIEKFCKKEIYCKIDNNQPVYENVTINESDFDIEYFITNIRKDCIDMQNDSDDIFIIESSEFTNKNNKIWIISQFSYPINLEIYPNKNVYCGGMEYNIFGLSNNITKEEFIREESSIIEKLVTESLEKDFNILQSQPINYDRNILIMLNDKYLCKTKYSINTETSNQLLQSHQTDIRYCAPKLSDKFNHDILKQPYYLCKGQQCFCPNIEKQFLEYSTSWKEYNLYQLLEIIGYPMIEYKNDFPTTKDAIRNFIGTINRINKILPHLKCNSCGHLLFSSNNGGPFNDYHYFWCKNKQCEQYHKRIYINKCFNCAKIIDSRESKKCENGLTICKECLSCCNDEMLERINKRYQEENLENPWNTRRNGHNDRDIFFCPKCGNQLENNSESKVCKTCNITYNKTPEHDGRTFIYQASPSNEYRNVNITR